MREPVVFVRLTIVEEPAVTRTATVPVFAGKGRIRFTEKTYRHPGSGELLLGVQANAMCGSDRRQYFGGSLVVPGHEAAGTVLVAGEGASIPVGRRGVVFLMDFCGECRNCRLGATNQCLALRAQMGFSQDGGYGPFEIVHETNFFPITDDVEIGHATLLLDVMGTSTHALRRAESVRQDIESIYIAGAGPVGLGLAVMSRLRYGPELPIHISGMSRWRLGLAESFGVTPMLANDEPALRAIGRPDIVFDASGRESARRIALDVLGQRGVLVCIGHGGSMALDVSRDLIAAEHAVLGSEYFRFDDLPGNLEVLRDHQDILGRIVSHRFPLRELGAAFKLFQSGETGKVVVMQDLPE